MDTLLWLDKGSGVAFAKIVFYIIGWIGYTHLLHWLKKLLTWRLLLPDIFALLPLL